MFSDKYSQYLNKESYLYLFIKKIDLKHLYNLINTILPVSTIVIFMEHNTTLLTTTLLNYPTLPISITSFIYHSLSFIDSSF